MDGAGVMYARRLSCRQWYAGYEKLCAMTFTVMTQSLDKGLRLT